MGRPLPNFPINLRGGSGARGVSGSDPSLRDPTSEPDGGSTRFCRCETHQSSRRLPAAAVERARVPTPHVKPRYAGTAADADADEGAALAGPDRKLPGDNNHNNDNHGSRDTTTTTTTAAAWSATSTRNTRRCGVVYGRQRRPSLERQDAFYDVRTAKRRRGGPALSRLPHPGFWPGAGRDVVLGRREVEDGMGEPAYAAGLAVSAPRPVCRVLYKTPQLDSMRLRVIYEFDDAAAAAAAGDDFLGSVSGVAFGVGEDGELAWAGLDGCNGMDENAAMATAMEGG
ncbi:hypothetical protein BT67DRAFT_268453 [Trichocladium antarcticum]|uniref:Uncharacterized protein n=1 Tax=Trichocladium antarcticum TaxID=1450529 RepID=A0AAN6UNZ2_9PEZI|nr:hypothetical protein BT67DRAFT_268453 [Trichocladium antarcticum]